MLEEILPQNITILGVTDPDSQVFINCFFFFFSLLKQPPPSGMTSEPATLLFCIKDLMRVSSHNLSSGVIQQTWL